MNLKLYNLYLIMNSCPGIRMVSVETLLYIIKESKILLIYKKRGLGKGLYNGVGGKVEAGETVEEAAIRECIEEIGVRPKNVEWRGLLEFWNNNHLYGYVHVFVASDFDGEPRETDEARPIWFNIDKIPYSNMWGDDIYWLPLILAGKKIFGRFWFVEWREIVQKELYLLNNSAI